jgi:peptide/nickel transport system substrate-binding protein
MVASSLIASLVTACSAMPINASRAQTVIFQGCCGFNESPENFNPFLPTSVSDQGLVQAAMAPLFLLDVQSGKAIPWLATGMTSSPDLKNWTMTLRPGVKWSDGKPFTAADVVFTM